jgi:hypothetical protein
MNQRLLLLDGLDQDGGQPAVVDALNALVIGPDQLGGDLLDILGEQADAAAAETLLRIAGAIQVLEELLADTDGLAARSAGTAGTSGETPDPARRPAGRVTADQPGSPADPA